jgi:hypothetical protein
MTFNVIRVTWLRPTHGYFYVNWHLYKRWFVADLQFKAVLRRIPLPFPLMVSSKLIPRINPPSVNTKCACRWKLSTSECSRNEVESLATKLIFQRSFHTEKNLTRGYSDVNGIVCENFLPSV